MTLQSLDSALELLEYFTREHPSWGVRELSRASGKHHAVVQRVLATFSQRGLLSQDRESGRYSLGVRMFEFGAAVRDRMHLTDLVHPILQQLADASGETIFLCWLEQKEAVCLDVTVSSNAVKFSTAVGARSPLHAACFTKVILAFQAAPFIDEVIAAGLPALTGKTVVNPHLLKTELETIRGQRWAYSEEESALDTCGLAVPIALRHGDVQASLCMAGPLHRNMGQRLLQHLPQLQQAAPQVAQAMRPFAEFH